MEAVAASMEAVAAERGRVAEVGVEVAVGIAGLVAELVRLLGVGEALYGEEQGDERHRLDGSFRRRGGRLLLFVRCLVMAFEKTVQMEGATAGRGAEAYPCPRGCGP